MTKECPDCRCELRRPDYDDKGNSSPFNTSPFCDHCLLERALAGQRIPGGTYEYDGHEHTVFYVLCQKCGGTGQFLVTARQPDTYCYRCLGLGVMDADQGSVQRWQRWSATFQGNKVNEVEK